jgi:hypothetical protein
LKNIDIDLDIGPRDFVVGAILILVFMAGIYCGAAIKGAKEMQATQIAIANAVEAVKEETPSPLSCKENELIEAIKNFSLNGVHLKTYHLSINFDYEDNAPAIVNAPEGG